MLLSARVSRGAPLKLDVVAPWLLTLDGQLAVIEIGIRIQRTLITCGVEVTPPCSRPRLNTSSGQNEEGRTRPAGAAPSSPAAPCDEAPGRRDQNELRSDSVNERPGL